ncbi:MAG: endonuclease domain-containing protein [Bacteroidetes bacterium]|nr:endonuclease domain-containing protein [Bacteroidota bacterium]
MVYKKRTVERKMFYGAEAKTFKYAYDLRQNMTKAELVLWEKLRKNQLNGFRFKPQHPIKWYIADFYCHKAKLVIEVDGEIHNTIKNKEYDKNRMYELEQVGLTIIRFTNQEVLNDIDTVLAKISSYLPTTPA